jgi:hypothetical protein
MESLIAVGEVLRDYQEPPKSPSRGRAEMLKSDTNFTKWDRFFLLPLWVTKKGRSHIRSPLKMRRDF